MKKGIILALFKRPSSAIGVLIILIAAAIAVAGANIRPDATIDANEQCIEIAKIRPFSTKKFLVTPQQVADSSNVWTRLFFGGAPGGRTAIPFDTIYIREGYLFYTAQRIKNERGQDLSSYRKVDIEPFLSFFQGEVVRRDGEVYLVKDNKEWLLNQQEFLSKLLRKQTETRFYLLGTDTFGRDLLSRMMGGTIVSLSVGLIAVVISLLIGIPMGAAAGYYGGWIDKAIMWVVNVVWSIPTMLMVIAITLALGKGFTQVFIAVGFTMWVEVARVVRGQFMQLREKDYAVAARLMGFSAWRIMFKHLLPGVVAPLIVISAGNFSTAILLESGLSFLGIGAQVPMPSWGGIIKAHFSYITTDLAYLALLPGLCLSLLTLAFMMVGNGLRDILDVRA